MMNGSSEDFLIFLKEEKYVKKAKGIFCRDYDKEWTGYISSELTNSDRYANFGVINQNVNSLMYQAIRKVVPVSPVKVKAVRFGPPLCLVSLQNLLTNTNQCFAGNSIGLISNMRQFGIKYIKDNMSLDSAVNSACKTSKYWQSSRYCLPVAFRLLGLVEQFDDYVAECIDNMQHPEETQMYRNYIKQLILDIQI
jgi:hypothetical protein